MPDRFVPGSQEEKTAKECLLNGRNNQHKKGYRSDRQKSQDPVHYEEEETPTLDYKRKRNKVVSEEAKGDQEDAQEDFPT